MQAVKIADAYMALSMRGIDHNVSALWEAEIRCVHAVLLKFGEFMQEAKPTGETVMPETFVNRFGKHAQ